jgi:glycine C-acetyltransferase
VKIGGRELDKLGCNTLASRTPIVPVVVGDIKLASRMSAMLFAEGVYVHTTGHPYVPQQSARLRNILSALHTEADLSFAAGKFRKVGKALGIINKTSGKRI